MLIFAALLTINYEVMETYKIIASTNGYIANRDVHFKGRTEITLDSNLTLEDARQKLDEYFTKDYDYSHDSLDAGYDEINNENLYKNDPNWTDHSDGTASYEYDSRYYRIIEEESDEY